MRPHFPTKEPAQIAERAGGGEDQPPREPLAPQRRREPEGPGEQYLRLRVRVEDGRLSIVDSHVVDGPLAQTAVFQGGYAYEVTDGSRLLHAGSIPDLGVFRGFAHPNGTPEQRRHHITQLSTYEFDARVPIPELRTAQLSSVSIVLYRVKQPPRLDAPPPPLGVESLARQREANLREIGRVVGLPRSLLPPDGTWRSPPEGRRGRKVRRDEGDQESS